MPDTVPAARGARTSTSGLAPGFSRRRVTAILRRRWRAYWDDQTRHATAVILYGLDDHMLVEIGICRDEVESLLGSECTAHVRRHDSP